MIDRLETIERTSPLTVAAASAVHPEQRKVRSAVQLSGMEEIMLSINVNRPPAPSPPTPASRFAEDVRRSSRLQERKRTTLGPFQFLPCEIVQHVLSFLPARALSQLAQVSTGWRLFLRDWIALKSTGWSLAPARRFPAESDDFYDEYTDLGILCRRLLAAGTWPERTRSFWNVVERVEGMSILRVGAAYQPTFLGVSNFYRAAVALNCCRSPAERFEAVWQVVKDTISVDTSLLEGEAGCNAECETDLRLALRVLFLLPRTPSRRTRAARHDRAALLRALLCKLPEAQQARLLFIVYGPRSGNAIEWRRPCDPSFSTLAQMVHVVAELGTCIQFLSQNSSPTFIYKLVCHLIKTPSSWLPRYEVMLLLTMGARAAGAVLAGHASRLSLQSRHIAVRMAQMVALSHLYKGKLESGEIESGPVLAAASLEIQEVFIYFFQFVSPNHCPLNLVKQVVSQSYVLAFNVGGFGFIDYITNTLNSVMAYFGEKLD